MVETTNHFATEIQWTMNINCLSACPKALSELTMRVLDLARKVWNFDCRGHNPGPSPNRPDDPTWSMGWIHPYQA